MIKNYQTIHPLMISLDINLLKQDYGNVLERQQEYAKHLGSMTIIVLNTIKANHPKYKPLHLDNLHIYPVNSKSRLLFILDTLRLITSINNNHKWNLISSQDLFITGLIGSLLKKKFKLPLNLQMHSDDILSPVWLNHSLQNRVFKQLANWNLSQADTLRYLNHRQLIYIKSIEPELVNQSFKAPIYTDTRYFFKPVKARKKIKKLVSVGRLSWEKNYSQLINAITQLNQQGQSISLALVGSGPELAYLKTQITKQGMDSKIYLVGAKSPEMVKKYLDDADAFILSSFYEGWGMAVAEAVAAGLPVIMPNTGCAGELIINNQTGTVYEDRSTTAIANAISESIKHPEKISTMGVAAQQLLESSYTKDKQVSSWLTCLYQTSLSNPKNV